MKLFGRIAQFGVSPAVQAALEDTRKEAADFDKSNNRKWYRQELHDQGYSWDRIDVITKDM